MNYPYYQFGVKDQLGSFRSQMQQVNQEEKIWVQGEDAAKDYLVTANGFVRLWDSNTNRFYEKRADGSGRPSMEIYEYKKIEEEKEPQFEDRMKELELRIAALEGKNEQSNGNDSEV